MQTQVELELSAYQFGKNRMAAAMRGNEEKGRAHNNPYAQAIFRRFVLPLASIIKEDLEEKRAGRRQAHVQLLKPIDPDAVAFIAVRTALVGLMAGKGDNLVEGAGRNIISEVGRSVYHEYVLDHFADVEPDLFYHLVNDFERRMSKNERHRMTVFKLQAQKAGVHFNEWGSGNCDQVGAYLVEQLTQLGMVSTHKVNVGHGRNTRTKIAVTMSEECMSLIDQIRDFAAESTPYYLPCVEPPKDWVSISDGGFHTKEMRRLMPYMVKMHPSQRDNFIEADLSQELAAINALQRTAWRINKPLLEAVRTVSKHYDMDEIISQAEEPKPAKPEWLLGDMSKDDMDESQIEEFVRWKRSMAEWHTRRKVRGTKWGRFSTAMRIANTFEEYERLWFVYFVDTRGRKYVQTTGISPQGSDLQKALIEFTDGKPLDTEEAIKWFKITGANRWGYDKCSLEDRATWVDTHHDLLLSFAADPVSHGGWQEADKPLQFLAWCMEYAAWYAAPSTFLSHCAVGMDGSCNGLQNFSAMLLDSQGGAATNLVPAPLPRDIYQMVADVTLRLLSNSEADEHGYRARWLSHGMNRTLVKRSVMTLPYGSTRYSCADFIHQDYLKEGKVPEFEKAEYAKAANYLSHFVWQAIAEVVVKAREAMDWLQAAARQLLREGQQDIKWITPSGFPAIQAYWEQDVHQIRTKLCGATVLKLNHDTDTPAVNRHKNGIAPNFIHSLDASHLSLVVNACEAEGIGSLAMIHDDFGTHAADAQRLYEIIRERFVWMYQTHDMLTELRERYPTLPEPPAKGSLDITQVLDSTYFFA